MADQITIADAINDTIEDIIARFDAETKREEVIEALDEDNDRLWGELVTVGFIPDYTVDDMVATAEDCAEIIRYAEDNAWVEDDSGLWDGLTYGILATIAYYSLRNCLYKALADAGYDSNDDYPFEGKDEDV